MEKAINTFRKGMNKDVDKLLLSKDEYLNAINFRINSDEESETGSLSPLKGHTLGVDISTGAGLTDSDFIIGYVEIRGGLILFTQQTGVDKIVRVLLDETSDGIVLQTPTILTTQDFSFSRANPISAVYRYESSTVEKIYWADGSNSVRYANIAISMAGLVASDFDILPGVEHTKINLEDISTGSLITGSIQYSYQFYQKNGAETNYAPPSALFHITQESDFLGESEKYIGSEKDTTAGKAFKLKVFDIDSRFDKIRIVSIYYDILNTIPIIKLT